MTTVACCSAGQFGTLGGHLVTVWSSVEYTVEVVIWMDLLSVIVAASVIMADEDEDCVSVTGLTVV